MTTASNTHASLVAAELMHLLRGAHWSRAHREFDPVLATGLTPERLRREWTCATERLGAFRAAGAGRTAVIDGYAVAEVDLHYADGRVLCRVTVDEYGRVAGLFVAATGPTPVLPTLAAGRAITGALMASRARD